MRTSYEYNPDGTLKRQKTGKRTEILTDTSYAYDEDRNLVGLKTLLHGGWQKEQEEVKNRFLYVGQQYDAVTMQYYLRARYYNPVVARFTQEDTYLGDGLNLYAYCQNNPVGYYDPSGYNGCGISKNGNSKSGSGSGTPNSGQGFSNKGYNPKPGERTIEGYVKNNANPEISLHANSAGFNNDNGNVGGDFKRYGAESHGGVSPHVHQPQRNVVPNGNVYGVLEVRPPMEELLRHQQKK